MQYYDSKSDHPPKNMQVVFLCMCVLSANNMQLLQDRIAQKNSPKGLLILRTTYISISISGLYFQHSLMFFSHILLYLMLQ